MAISTASAEAHDHGHHLRMLALGLLTTFLWASSFVLIKVGVGHIGPLTLAAFRYTIAFLILLPIAIRVDGSSFRNFSGGVWLRLALIGIAGYPLANGLLFWSLTRIPPTTSSFTFNLTPFLVLLIGVFALREMPTLAQWLGFAVTAVGIAVFFALPLGQGEVIGVIATACGALGFAWFTVQARGLARVQRMGAVSLTAWPLGIGGVILLIIAFLVEGIQSWDLTALFVVLWLAVLNTAIANAVWMRALGSLKAFELSVLMTIMPVETALISWLAVGEEFTANKLLGIALVVPGVLLVQRVTRSGAATAPQPKTAEV